ncbi:sugar dehydrogenase complex small subunit [Ralstonia sp. 1138]|uniref:sugar dehydrogenase complex small subunit n=1 Tax=Ralstonia sp. 1138 TaxID=3156423 RepID=UPI0033963EA5
MSLPSSSPRPTKPAQPSKPAHFRRRDFVLGCGALLVLGAAPGFRPPSHDASSLDDFMLVSQTIAGAPLDRHVGLACFSHLHGADDRFIQHIQTLAWLVRRNPGLDGVGLVRLLDADNAYELRAALARLVDAWGVRLDAHPAWGDVRPLIVSVSGAGLPGS